MNVRLALAPLLTGACLLTLSGCRTQAPAALPAALPVALTARPVAPPPLSVSTGALSVSCTPHGISVTGTSVVAGPVGVPIRVSSTAAKGTYLNYTWTGAGGGGHAVPTSATTWTLTAPPGPLRLSCSTAFKESPEKVVAVVDPGRHWRATTLADLGCLGGAPVDWAAGPGRGVTAEAAISDAIKQMSTPYAGWLRAPVTMTRADIGYSGSASVTWLVSSAGRPYMTMGVTKEKDGFAARAHALC